MKAFFASAFLIAVGILLADVIRLAIQLGALYLLNR